MFTKREEDAFRAICDVTEEQLVGSLECSIERSEYVLDECFVRAERTKGVLIDVTKEGATLNHYKEAGLMCYWIKRLKPYSLDKFDYQQAEDEKKNRLNQFPLNEYLAFVCAQNYIFCMQLELAEMSESVITVEKIKENQNKIVDMEVPIARSLRYHNYSVGSTTSLLQSLSSI